MVLKNAIPLSLLLSLNCLCSTAPACGKSLPETKTAPSKGKEPAWVLEQITSQLGKMTVYAGKKALRLRIGTTGGNLIAKAPDWKVVFYNTKDKMIYEATYERFLRQELPSLIATSDYFEGKKLQPSLVSYSGWRALRVSAPTPEGTVGMLMPTWSGVGNARSSQSKSVAVFATETADVPAKELSILQAIYRLPKFGGFPLGVIFKHGDGSIGITLKTNSLKHEQVSSALFNANTDGYKRAKTAENVMLSGLVESAFMETP